MLWIIAILLAAILITLLGAWRVIPGILVGIVVFILWLLLAAAADHHLGDGWFGAVIALPFVALILFGLHQTASGKMDLWGNPIDEPAGTKDASRRKTERNRARRAKAAENRPKWEKGRPVGREESS